MPFRLISAPIAVFFAWAAAMQLNDPDPERWFLLYASASIVAVLSAMGWARPRLALALALVGLAWAVAIVPELWPGWTLHDLGAQMKPERPEIEYGREFVGLLIVAAYALAAARFATKGSASKAPIGV